MSTTISAFALLLKLRGVAGHPLGIRWAFAGQLLVLTPPAIAEKWLSIRIYGMPFAPGTDSRFLEK